MNLGETHINKTQPYLMVNYQLLLGNVGGYQYGSSIGFFEILEDSIAGPLQSPNKSKRIPSGCESNSSNDQPLVFIDAIVHTKSTRAEKHEEAMGMHEVVQHL